MTVFDHYAKYYDLLYRDKDYAGEAAYVLDLLASNGVTGGSLLELGCGTGKHALEFARAGFAVDGYDLSPEMVATAHTLKQKAGVEINFQVGDARTLRTGKKYNAVVSLFHVASYQTETIDLLAMFETAAEHLMPGGIFVFDCWYGPGVLTDLPVVRVKRWEDEVCRIARIAEPVMHPGRNVVDVKYTIFAFDKAGNSWATIEETHPMRYLFEPEVKMLLNKASMAICACLHWGTHEQASLGSWQSMFVVRAG